MTMSCNILSSLYHLVVLNNLATTNTIRPPSPDKTEKLFTYSSKKKVEYLKAVWRQGILIGGKAWDK